MMPLLPLTLALVCLALAYAGCWVCAWGAFAEHWWACVLAVVFGYGLAGVAGVAACWFIGLTIMAIGAQS